MKTLALLAALFAVAPALSARAEDGAADDYARALDKENTDRDLNSALEIYKSIVKKHRDEEDIAAKAQYRIGECWDKLGVPAEAKAAYEALVHDFPAQTALVEKARERLAAIAGAPAAEVVKDPAERLTKKLDSMKIDLDFTDSALTDILEFLSEFTKTSVLIDPEISEQVSNKFTFAVKDLNVHKVLDLLADVTHLSWTNYHGIIVWGTHDRVQALGQMQPIVAEVNSSEDDRKIEKSIQSLKISLNFSETPLAETLNFISEISDLNVVLDPQCPAKNISLKMDECRLDDVLTLIAFTNGLAIEIKNGVLMVRGK